MELWDSAPELKDALVEQEKGDGLRWGDTWKKRTRKGQEWRTLVVYTRYFFRYFFLREPIPWLKVIGNAHICWYREQHPELWKK